MHNVPPLLVSCEVRNFIFSVKDRNSCEMWTWTYNKIRNCEKRLLYAGFVFPLVSLIFHFHLFSVGHFLFHFRPSFVGFGHCLVRLRQCLFGSCPSLFGLRQRLVGFCPSLVAFGGCLFYFGRCLVDFGRCLFGFGGCLVYFGGCLVHFGGCLVHFGGCLFHFGGCLVHFSGCLVHFLISLFQKLLFSVSSNVSFFCRKIFEKLAYNVLRLAVWCGILALNIANINKILVQDYFSKEARTPH